MTNAQPIGIQISGQDDDVTMGRLTNELTGEEVKYEEFQLSRYGISFNTSACLQPGEHVMLDSQMGYLRLCIIKVEAVDAKGSIYQYMAVHDKRDRDLQEDFLKAMLAKSDADERNRGGRHFTRFLTKPPIKLMARTFGSITVYEFKSINVSKCRILMATQTKHRLPFKKETILEVAIFLDEDPKTEPVEGVAKIIHSSTPDPQSKLQYLEVELTEFLGKGEDIWNEMLDQKEKSIISAATRRMFSNRAG